MQRGEAGATHVLEAVIVAGIMLSAVCYVATFEGPPPNPSIIEDGIYGPKAEDFLRVMDDAPSKQCGTNTRLESLVVDGARGNHTDYNSLIRGFLDPGVYTELLLDNLHHHLHLHGGNEMGLTRDVTIFPRWGQPASFQEAAATGLDHTHLQVPSMKNSELVRMKSEAARTAVHTEDALGARSYQAWSATAILPFDGRGGVEGMAWNGTADGHLSLTRAEGQDDLQAIVNSKAIAITLSISGTNTREVRTIPANSGIRVQFPQGWSVEGQAPNDFSLRVSNRDAGSTVVYTALNDIVGGRDIVIRAHPPSTPTHPFDIIRASAFNGSFGESSLVFQYPVSVSASLPRQVFPTTPYPVKPGSTAFFGAAFTNGGANTTVTHVDIEIPGGYDIWANHAAGAQIFGGHDREQFADLGAGADHGSWTILDSRHAQWSGSVVVPALSAVWFGAYLPITSWTNQTTSIEPPVGEGPSVTLGFPNGASFTSNAWGKSPGIVTLDVPNETVDLASQTPNGDGYRVGDSTFNVTVVGTSNQYGYQFANGTLATDALDAGTMDSAAANSTFDVRDRLVPVGQFVTADADFSSVLSALSSNGVTTSNLTVDLYAPPSFSCAPTASWTIDTKSLPHPRVGAMKLMSFAGGVGPDLVAGLADQHVYRLDATRNAVANSPVASTASAIAQWGSGSLDQGVLVGDDAGYLSRIDPSGGVRWRTCVAAACDPPVGSATLRNVTHIAALVATDAIAAAAEDGRVALLHAETGHVLHTTDIADTLVGLDVSPDEGDIIVAGSLALHDLAPDLSERAKLDGHFVAIAVEPTDPPSILTANDDGVRRHDVRTLVDHGALYLDEHAFARVGGAGDVDGDGYPEIAVAFDDGLIAVVHGATGEAHAYSTSARQEGLHTPWSILNMGCDIPQQGGYSSTDATCVGSVSGDGLPPVLSVGPSGVAVLHDDGLTVQLLDIDASSRWTSAWSGVARPRLIEAGRYGLEDVVLVGGDDGTIEVFSQASGSPGDTVSPSSVAGSFTLRLPTPSGGFYGSNLLVASLQWVDGASHAQRVQLVDWFEVVGEHGAVVTNPTYRVILAVKPGDDYAKPAR